MKSLRWFVFAGLAFLLAAAYAADGKVFSKRRDLELKESGAPEAKTVAKAQWNEELKVLEQKGRWMKVSSGDGEGWVYAGNVSAARLPEENKNDVPIKASSLTSTAAARGLSDGADSYASRHSLGEVAGQVRWAEKFNREISKADATAYLKQNKYGEYAEGK